MFCAFLSGGSDHGKSHKNGFKKIDDYNRQLFSSLNKDMIVSWVIRATWQEIQRFVWKFKAKYTVYDSTLKTFAFINHTNKFMFTTEMNWT